MGLLRAPPPFLSHSYTPYSLQQPPQPPLLPLPAAHPRRSSSCQGILHPPVNKTCSNRTRDHSLTLKKSKSPTKNPKKEEKEPLKRSSDIVIVSSTGPSGPDPRELPKNVLEVFPLEDPVDKLPDSVVVFTMSPPPSSLPLPSFSLRPKLSCKAEAAGVDTGATDNLRRLLRLR